MGIFVKNSVLDHFTVNIVDKAYDGILCLRFEHRGSQYFFIIISCYLSPETSTWGRNADFFFSHLLVLIYSTDVGSVYLCGDVNSRIADLRDYAAGDDISSRAALDTVVNKHGETFIEFLKDSKCCVLNGRLNPENDNFTSISVKGKAVVDYIVTPHVDLKTCLEFSVFTPSDLLQRVGFEGINLIDDHSRIPDHSALCLRFQTGEVFNNDNGLEFQGQVRRRRRNFPVNFLTSEISRKALIEIIDQLDFGQKTQDNVDYCYDRLCDFLHKELDKYGAVKKDVEKKFYRTKQPYWNNELNELWLNSRAAEKMFLKCKDQSKRRDLKIAFKRCQHDFD